MASTLSLPAQLPSLGFDPTKQICDAVTRKPTAAARILENLKKIFADGTVTQKFPLSVAYINQQSTQLLAGGDSCRFFFNGLVTPFQTDLQNNKQNVQNAQQKLIQYIIGKFPQIMGFLG